MDFESALKNLEVIFKAASSKCKVIEEKFPAKFFENDPVKIYESYCKFIKNRSNSDGDIRNEDKLVLTSISERFENGEYMDVKKNSFYRLFHDIKLVCTILVHYYHQGTRNYLMVDKFYKFASELLMRESYRLGVQFSKHAKDKSVTVDKSELDDIIGHDFIKISMNYKVPMSQNYHIKTQNEELFSSKITRSSLDERKHELPNINYEINNIIPVNSDNDSTNLGFVSANISNIPDPTLPPTEIMTKYLHPNWYLLPSIEWLNYDEYKSWAPFLNENGSVVDMSISSKIWLKTHAQKAIEVDNDKENESKLEKEVTIEKKEIKESREDIKEEEEEEEEDSIIDIKLDNVLQWKPNNKITDEEINSFKNGKQDQLLNTLLIRLNKLRRDRINKNELNIVNKEETQLYNQIKRILNEVVLNSKIKINTKNCIRSFPLLQANYNGSIPVTRSHVTKKRKSKKQN